MRPIRLMVVDDSMVARAVLSRMIEADGQFDIVGVAGTAEDAIVALAHVEVDIVLLDLEMPGVGGLKAIPRILEAATDDTTITVVGRRGWRRGDRRGAGAGRGGYTAQAGDGTFQRALFRSLDRAVAGAGPRRAGPEGAARVVRDGSRKPS
jgi:DNA-binding NarL/FixJ family response regulator